MVGELGDAVQHLLADRQDLALEGVLVGDVGAGRDDRLGDKRHRVDDLDAQPGRVDADIAPGDECLAFGVDIMLEMLDRDGACLAAILARSQTPAFRPFLPLKGKARPRYAILDSMHDSIWERESRLRGAAVI